MPPGLKGEPPGPSPRAAVNACVGTFLAWSLASCGFWGITFALGEIRGRFRLTEAQVAALVSVALGARLLGALVAGALAEFLGRKRPLLLAVAVCGLSGAGAALADSYGALLWARWLFGLGLGGIWVAGMALALDQLEGPARGRASGVLQAGWSWGYLASALTDAALAALAAGEARWRWLVLLAALPALAAAWIVPLARDARPPGLAPSRLLAGLRRGPGRPPPLPLTKLAVTAAHATLVMSTFMGLYFSLTAFYPNFLRGAGSAPLGYVAVLNGAGIGGAFLAGHLSSTRLGHRGVVTVGACASLCALPLYLHEDRLLRGLGAAAMGLTALGMWGVVPRYLGDRFPPPVRALGPGLAYHGGALLAAPAPVGVGAMLDRGVGLPAAIAIAAVASAVAMVVVIWLGPEGWQPPAPADGGRALEESDP
jgi:SHS family lactate transporter-like MFS transporter